MEDLDLQSVVLRFLSTTVLVRGNFFFEARGGWVGVVGGGGGGGFTLPIRIACYFIDCMSLLAS